jgi:hypothetical protein
MTPTPEHRKKYKEWIFGAVLIVLILGGSFYWFQLRPAEIKTECSWVPQYVAAVPGVTQEQIDAQQTAYNNCVKKYPTKCGTGQVYLGSICHVAPQCAGMPTGYDEDPHAAVPAQTTYIPTDEATYTFCLQSHGL